MNRDNDKAHGDAFRVIKILMEIFVFFYNRFIVGFYPIKISCFKASRIAFYEQCSALFYDIVFYVLSACFYVLRALSQRNVLFGIRQLRRIKLVQISTTINRIFITSFDNEIITRKLRFDHVDHASSWRTNSPREGEGV